MRTPLPSDRLRRPLAEIFLRKLIGAYLLFGILIFGIQLVVEYRSHRQQLVDSLQTLATTFAPGAAAALWDFQENSLESMVSGIGLQSDVVAVEIQGTKGNQSFSWTSPDGAQASPALRVELPLTLVDRAGVRRSVGVLVIASNEDRLWVRLRSVIFSLFQVALSLMLALGVVVWVLVNRLVVRPLLQFSERVNALEGASTQEAIDLDHTAVREIATLQAGFNRLMHQVGEDQKRIEEHNSTLEHKVAERTQALEAASKAKSEFLARMSHEIRTPMNAVIGLSQLTLRTDLTPLQRDYLQKVLGSAQALLGIINDILDFSKIEAGKLALEQIDMDVNAVLEHLVNVVGIKADEKGLALHQQIAPDVPLHLIGDPLRLGQVLLNLVGNAIKFTEQGHVSIAVTVVERTAQQVRLRFCIEDTGIGLMPAQVNSLFQSFHQADGSVTRRFGGTGLGLAITKQLVELMQGQVWVDSTSGVGSRFFVEMAFGISTTAPVQVERRVREIDDAQTRRKTDPIKGARVLVVEDNAINQLVARNFLEINGVQVDIAHNGAQGVEMALGGHYALVLMDIQMPVMDGLTAARTIRATPGFENLPIVAMTANAMVTDYQNSLDAGMNDHITKPIDQNLLTQTLLRWIAPRPQPGVPPTGPAEHAPVELPTSAHLDTARGLSQLGGATDLYRNVLKSFLDSHADDAHSIRRALEQAHTTDARRMVHTLKGIAATLGATALSRSAAELEQVLREHDTPSAQDAQATATALAAVQHHLQGLRHDLAAFFAAFAVDVPVVQRAATAAEQAILLQGLQQLAPLLLAADLGAIDVGAALRQQLAQSPWKGALDALQTQIDTMAFAAASVQVSDLLRQLGGAPATAPGSPA